jgi:hypothetical protein
VDLSLLEFSLLKVLFVPSILPYIHIALVLFLCSNFFFLGFCVNWDGAGWVKGGKAGILLRLGWLEECNHIGGTAL